MSSEVYTFRVFAWPITATLLGLFALMGYGCDRTLQHDEAQLAACVESGGVWIARPSQCIRTIERQPK